MSADLARRGSVAAWVMACRPATLAAAFVPVAVGSAVAIAERGFRAGPAAAALIGALLLQVGANLANDVFDYEKGADTAERLGPVRAVQAGLLSAAEVRAGMTLVFALALLVGAYLTAVAGPAIVVIGLGSIACAIAYTGGPFPLGYNGLGDVFVMLFFGFVAVCGTAFVQLGAIPVLGWWCALPVGALATAILVVNNVRDRETDERAGKRTLAVRFGRCFGVAEYVVLLGTAFAVPVALVVTGRLAVPGLLPVSAAPLAVPLLRSVARDRGAMLNRTLLATARLLFVFGLAFAAGIVLGAR